MPVKTDTLKPWLGVYQDGVPEHLSYEDLTLPDFLDRSVANFPDNRALNFMGYTISYAELDRMVRQFAAFLYKSGIRRGDRVALVMPNLIPCVAAYYAVLKIGGVVVLNNPLYTDSELLHQFVDSNSKAAVVLGDNLDWWEARWENRTYLEPLVDPDVPLRPMALLVLAIGLAAKEPGEHGLATDAAIAAIADGRLDGTKLGSVMATLLPTGLIKAARWAKTLGEAARISPLHAEIVRAAIARSLRGQPRSYPKDLHALVELLKELVVGTGGRIDEDVVEVQVVVDYLSSQRWQRRPRRGGEIRNHLVDVGRAG